MPLTTDVLIQELAFDTVPTGGTPALALKVQRLTATLGDPWLEKMCRLGLAAAAGKSPVGISYVASRFLPDGAELTFKAGEGFMSLSPTLRLEVAGEGAGQVRIKVAEIRSAMPVEKIVGPFLDKLIDNLCARPGVQRHPAEPRAVLVSMNAMLQARGLTFSEDALWIVSGQAGELTIQLQSKDLPPS